MVNHACFCDAFSTGRNGCNEAASSGHVPRTLPDVRGGCEGATGLSRLEDFHSCRYINHRPPAASGKGATGPLGVDAILVHQFLVMTNASVMSEVLWMPLARCMHI